MWRLCALLLLLPLVVYAAPWATEGSTPGCVPEYVKYQTGSGQGTFAIGPGVWTWNPYEGVVGDHLKTSSDAILADCFEWEGGNGQLEIRYVCEDRYFDVKIQANGYVANTTRATVFRLDLAENEGTSAAFALAHVYDLGTSLAYSAYSNDPAGTNTRRQITWHNRIQLAEDAYYGILLYWNTGVTSTFQPLESMFILFTTDDCARGDV